MSFEGKKIIEDVSINLKKGEIVSLLGVSGAGKTTLFNVLSGLISPDGDGRILLSDEDITGKTGKISYMLQKDLLLPHYTVLDNAALPLRIQGMGRKESREKAAELLEVFGLEGTDKKYPAQLSGGMKQRVALMRTYLSSKGVALLDEPFSALDSMTKSQIHFWYLDVMKKIELSTLFVTHDIDEAILLSDRIYILSGSPGRITDEIVVELSEDKRQRDPLSNGFIEYKRLISKKFSLCP